MYKNILHNPEKVTDLELEDLQRRRLKEKQIILEKDLESNEIHVNLNGGQEESNYWYIVSSEWLY